MSGWKCVLCIICFLAVIAISGCIVVSREPSAVEVHEVEIGFPPPPPPEVVVTRPPRPSRLYVWVEGHYAVESGSWVWVGGRWVRPEHRGAVWVPGHTRQRGRGWVWRPGHWR
jgi:hypothetical protein